MIKGNTRIGPAIGVYQTAKAIVTGEIEELSPQRVSCRTCSGPDAIAPYQGYDLDVNSKINQEFAGAAYRFGHSIVSGGLGQINELVTQTYFEDLNNAFFEPGSQFVAERRR